VHARGSPALAPQVAAQLPADVATAEASPASTADPPSEPVHAARARRRRTASTLLCQVTTCGVVLDNLRAYHQRNKLCAGHMRAASLVLNGETLRFCQKCVRPLVLVGCACGHTPLTRRTGAGATGCSRSRTLTGQNIPARRR
jgi:hypothetical protein